MRRQAILDLANTTKINKILHRGNRS